MMEKLAPEYQRLLAKVIAEPFETDKLSQQEERGIKRLGREKVLGLMKSKGKRRWYDEDALVHQAFNYMYLMPETLRREMAYKIIIAIRALEEAVLREQSEKEHRSLVRGIFEKPLDELLEKTPITRQTEAKSTPSSLRFYPSTNTSTDAKEPSPTSAEQRPHPLETDAIGMPNTQTSTPQGASDVSQEGTRLKFQPNQRHQA